MPTLTANPLLGFGIMTAGIAVAALAADDRLALVALIAQYVGSAFVMAATSAQTIAWLHLLVGGLAAVVLYLGVRTRPADDSDRAAAPRLPFRAVSLLLTWAAGGVLAVQWPLPYVDGLTSLACYALAAGFAAQMGLFREPARVGMATLTLLTVASIYAQAAGGTLFLIAMILSGHLLTGLAASHAHSAPCAAEEEPQ